LAVIGALKTFKGGHYFAPFQGTPRGRRIEHAPMPQRVVCLTRQGFGQETLPIVKVGELVRAGQIIARADNVISTPVHAGISGTVQAIESCPHPLGGPPTQMIVIASDGRDEWQMLKRPAGNFEKWGREEIGRVLYEAGMTAGGRAGFPTANHTSLVEPGDITHLLINAVETEPYVEGDAQLLTDDFEKLLTGIKILRAGLGNVEVHIGIGYNQPRAIELLQTSMEYYDWFHIHPLLPKYPQGEDEVLIKSLLDREVPSGRTTPQIGVVVSDVQHCVAAYEAVLEGRPFIERVISVGGSAIERPGNLRVRVGTPSGELLSQRGLRSPARIILGGPLRGTSLSDVDLPILRDTRALVALAEPRRRLFPQAGPGFGYDSYTNILPPVGLKAKRATTGLNGPERPCIRCGYCVDVCPQNLFPIFLAERSERGLLREAEKLDIFACIDCGLCSYVCPSKIALTEQIIKGKVALREGL
jgi:electron transport complex protein RnfC